MSKNKKELIFSTISGLRQTNYSDHVKRRNRYGLKFGFIYSTLR